MKVLKRFQDFETADFIQLSETNKDTFEVTEGNEEKEKTAVYTFRNKEAAVKSFSVKCFSSIAFK